jgi:hypothetical protein
MKAVTGREVRQIFSLDVTFGRNKEGNSVLATINSKMLRVKHAVQSVTG